MSDDFITYAASDEEIISTNDGHTYVTVRLDDLEHAVEVFGSDDHSLSGAELDALERLEEAVREAL